MTDSDDLPFHEVFIDLCDELSKGEAPTFGLKPDVKVALRAYALLLARRPKLDEANHKRCEMALKKAALCSSCILDVNKILATA